MQKEINLSAPDKDHIILTKYEQAYLTSVLTQNLSKHLQKVENSNGCIKGNREVIAQVETPDNQKLCPQPNTAFVARNLRSGGGNREVIRIE